MVNINPGYQSCSQIMLVLSKKKIENHINDIHGLVHTLIINSILYMEKIRLWKILSSSAMSSSDYTHDVLLHQPCMCNNNDRAARLIKFPITGTASCKTKKLSIFSAKSTFLIFHVFALRQ